MAVGTDPIEAYEGNNVSWEFTFTDPTGNVTSLSGMDIDLWIKVDQAATGAALITAQCTITSATAPMKFKAEFLLDLDPGTYVVGARRQDSGFIWDTVDAPLTVKDSVFRDA